MVSLLANMYLQETFLDRRTIEKGENGGGGGGGKGLLCINQTKDVVFEPVLYLSIIFCLLLNLYDR
jgi:hypothetical protein